MAPNLLAALHLAGVIERGGRHRRLRVSPRFLAHAERTASQWTGLGLHPEPREVLQAALRSWDEYRHDPEAGAGLLLQALEERHQLGSLRPVFPAPAPLAA